MSPRFEALEMVRRCPVRGPMYARLNTKEKNMLIEFLRANEFLGNDEFALAVNRWMIDDKDRPKHSSFMLAICTEINSIAINYEPKRRD